jgi:hypothetical protein
LIMVIIFSVEVWYSPKVELLGVKTKTNMRVLMQELGLRENNSENLVKLQFKFLNREMKIYLRNSIQIMTNHLNLVSLVQSFKQIDLHMLEHPINKEEVQELVKMEI